MDSGMSVVRRLDGNTTVQPHIDVKAPSLIRLTSLLLIVVFGCTLALNLFLLPREPALGLDFLLFYGTALTVRRGYSPYDAPHRGQVLRSLPLLSRPHQHMVAGLYGNPPLFAWALTPLTHLPPIVAYVVWVAILVTATLISVLMLRRMFHPEAGEAYHKLPLYLLLFTLSPASMYAYFMGQLAPLLLLGATVSIMALRRVGRERHSYRYAALSGLLLNVVWLKPHLLLPIVLMIGLLLPRRHALPWIGGFLGGSALGTILSIELLGRTVFLSWAQGLAAFGRSFGVQPGVSSLAGLYQPALGPTWSTIVSGGLVVLWILFASQLVLYARRHRLMPGEDTWLRVISLALASWLLVVPYTHTPDMPLIALTLPALLGRAGERWADLRVRVAVAVLLIAPEIDLIGGFALSATMAYSVLVPIALIAALRPINLLRCSPTA